MAEFCKECFLKLNPEFEEKDLQLLKEEALCEGCGKIVDKIVVNIKPYFPLGKYIENAKILKK